MAYISQQQQQEEEQRRQAAGGGGAGPDAPDATAAPQAQPSRFVRFSQLLNANRDAASRTADHLVGGVDAQGAKLQNDLTAAKTDFTNALPAVPALKPYEESFEAPQASGSLAGTPGWQALQDRAAQVQDSANLLSSQHGRQAALGEYGRGGELDAALAGGAGASKFRAARDRYGRLSDILKGADADSADAVRRRNEEIERRRSEWEKAHEHWQHQIDSAAPRMPGAVGEIPERYDINPHVRPRLRRGMP